MRDGVPALRASRAAEGVEAEASAFLSVSSRSGDERTQKKRYSDEKNILEEFISTQAEGRNARAVFFLQIGFDVTELRIDDEAPAMGLSW